MSTTSTSDFLEDASLLRYSYEPLGTGATAIRLLTLLPSNIPDTTIACSLRVANIGDDLKYEALSYAWGSQALTQNVSISGHIHNITENLAAALRHLRSPTTPRDFWIDALCINQTNLEERSEQVSRMSDIFRRATRVVVWLGNLAECPKSPSQLVTQLAHGRHIMDAPHSQARTEKEVIQTLQSEFSSLRNMITRPWWNRLWCVQEIFVAREVILLYGSEEISWTALQLAYTNFRLHLATCCSHIRRTLPSWVVMTRADIMLSDFRPRSAEGLLLSNDLDQTLRVYRHKRCQDPRDKVYSLLGLLDMTRYPGLSPDYTKDTKTVWCDAVRAIHDTDPEDLRFLTGPYGIDADGFPSWIRCIGTRQICCRALAEKHRFEQYRIYSAAGKSRAKVRFNSVYQLELQGVHIATADKVGAPRICVHNNLAYMDDWLRMVGLEEGSPRNSSTDAVYNEEDKTWSRLEENELDAMIPTMRRVHGEDFDLKDTKAISIQESMFAATMQKSFFVSNEGAMGVCEVETKPGDEVWVLLGGNLPFILRPAPTGSHAESLYELVGDCYVEGFMDGEALELRCGVKNISIR